MQKWRKSLIGTFQSLVYKITSRAFFGVQFVTKFVTKCVSQKRESFQQSLLHFKRSPLSLLSSWNRPKMNSNSVHFKAFLRDGDGNNREARRFVIEDASMVTSFEYMKEKLRMVYPAIRDTVFRVTWKDEDGDEITITCDDDLLTAVTEMTERVKTLTVTILERTKSNIDFNIDAEEPRPTYSNVICDGCDAPIHGFRYKCVTCADYDLCSRCEQCGLHAEHVMMRMANAEAYVPRCTRKLAAHWARAMRKGQHFANREASRAAKCAAGAAAGAASGAGKCGEKARGSAESRAGTSRGEARSSEEAPVFGSLSAITEMAMPFVEMFAQNVNGAQGEQVVESIRRALNNFMDQNNTTNNNNNNNSAEPPKPNNETASKSTEDMDLGNEPSSTEKTNNNKESEWTFLGRNPESDPKIVEGLQKLLDMGFANEEHLVFLLKRFHGNVEAVLKCLFEAEGGNRNLFK